MIYLRTKFDVSMFTHYEDMKGNANVEIGGSFGRFGSSKIPK